MIFLSWIKLNFAMGWKFLRLCWKTMKSRGKRGLNCLGLTWGKRWSCVMSLIAWFVLISWKIRWSVRARIALRSSVEAAYRGWPVLFVSLQTLKRIASSIYIWWKLWKSCSSGARCARRGLNMENRKHTTKLVGQRIIQFALFVLQIKHWRLDLKTVRKFYFLQRAHLKSLRRKIVFFGNQMKTLLQVLCNRKLKLNHLWFQRKPRFLNFFRLQSKVYFRKLYPNQRYLIKNHLWQKLHLLNKFRVHRSQYFP